MTHYTGNLSILPYRYSKQRIAFSRRLPRSISELRGRGKAAPATWTQHNVVPGHWKPTFFVTFANGKCCVWRMHANDLSTGLGSVNVTTFLPSGVRCSNRLSTTTVSSPTGGRPRSPASARQYRNCRPRDRTFRLNTHLGERPAYIFYFRSAHSLFRVGQRA